MNQSKDDMRNPIDHQDSMRVGYAGLAPSRRDSGNIKRHGSITNQGSLLYAAKLLESEDIFPVESGESKRI